MKLFKFSTVLACIAGLVSQSHGASVVFDDFNVGLGHFSSNPSTGSGSTQNVANNSTNTRITTNSPVEGSGQNRLFLVSSNSAAIRLRHLSGAGTPANNTSFTTSSADDGWIGFYLKTTNSDWNVQPWLEGASVNGGTPKNVIGDGDWHLYEWNLEDTSGGPDGWGSIAGIIGGVATVADGAHTFDSIVFRTAGFPPSLPFTNIIYMDYVAKSDTGSVSNLLLNPCINTSGVLVTGPLATNSNQVTVTGVASNATAVTVYQNTGSGGSMVSIGTRTTGIVAGNNFVTVSGMVKGAQVAATQTISGQESCIPNSGLFAGGGANPSIRVALSVRETSSTGPAGTAGNTSSGNIHFFGASTISSSAPIDATVVNPSNAWQTITFQRGTESIGDSANADGTISAAAAYGGNDTVSIQVYAFRTWKGVTIYSVSSANSPDKNDPNPFRVNWTWDSVPGAQGYRVLRNVNFAGFTEYRDVTTNSLSDLNTGWTAGTTVTPNTTVTTPSVKWNLGSGDPVGTQNAIGTQWGILEAIAFSISDLSDTGPFDIYIDNIQNGTTVFQDFEGAVSGKADYAFRTPTFSGTTSGSILTAPDVGLVSNAAADSGTKSLHIQFQWSGTNATKWLRFTTSGLGDPQIDLDALTSMRILVLPKGAVPVAPAKPVLSIGRSGASVNLNWTGTHNLQQAAVVTGPYTTVTNATVAPFTTNTTSSAQFFRLTN